MNIEGERWSEHRLRLALPQGWQAFVPLPTDSDGVWLAQSFDALIDSPVETGPHPVHHFAVADVPQ